MSADNIAVLPSYVLGGWDRGTGDGYLALNPVTGKPIYRITSEGFDFRSVLEYARKQGKDIRHFTFHERCYHITDLAKHLNRIKEKYYPLSLMTGATLRDSKIDVDGGISTLFSVSSLAKRGLPDSKVAYEKGYESLSRHGSFQGKHLLASKQGAAILINSFNFPCWGMLEKFANAYIAGMPVIVKPASVTSYLTQAMVEDIIASSILPPGAIQVICGSFENKSENNSKGLFSHLMEQDVVSFTGSASTAVKLKSHPTIIEKNIPFYTEADSLNFALLSPRAVPDDPEFIACVDETVKEITTKAGQRCTCIRRLFLPDHLVEAATQALIVRLDKVKVGDPADPDVNMGSLVSREQLRDVEAGVKKLSEGSSLLYHNPYRGEGAFQQPTLLLDKLSSTSLTHSLEVFGPVTTLIPFKKWEDALEGIKWGRGSLTGSIYSNHPEEIQDAIAEVGAWHGRINLINRDGVGENPGHGTVMPQMIHGGPGRAGGSEELGGVRGIKHFLQRVGVQGHPALLGKISGEWPALKREPVNPETQPSTVHPFKKGFEELEVGEGITTHRRTITEADVVNFGCLSWDHFYAHFDEAAAGRSFFKKRVAHGYFILSAAAGLFVDPAEGPVLANVGLEDLRFLEPVYPGDTIYAQLTCKQKTFKPRKDEDKPPFGEVKWQVMVYNQEEVLVAEYVVVTLIRRRDSR